MTPHQAAHLTDESITFRQRLLECRASPQTWGEYMRVARWWELEGLRGYPSSGDSLRYAANMRWAAELTHEYGPGTWSQLLQRSGHWNPVVGRAVGGAVSTARKESA